MIPEWLQPIALIAFGIFFLVQMHRQEKELEDRLRQIEQGLDQLHFRLKALEE